MTIEICSATRGSLTREETISEKERVVRSLREVLTSRDADNRELQIELSALRAEKASWDPRLRELEANIRLEQDRFGKLFKLAMELDAELKEAKAQIDARDRWYKKNVLVMSNIKRAMDEHDNMIQAAQGRAYEPDLEGELMRLRGESEVPK